MFYLKQRIFSSGIRSAVVKVKGSVIS